MKDLHPIVKYTRYALATVGLGVAMFFARKAKAEDSGWLARVTASPVVALQTAGITGSSQLGAGVDFGVNVNPYVSVHGTALGYENEDWKNGVVDESEFYGRANFTSFAKERFVVYGKGGVVRDWTQDDWAFGVGLGAELKLHKHVSLASDYTIRAWFNGNEKDSLARLLVNFSF